MRHNKDEYYVLQNMKKYFERKEYEPKNMLKGIKRESLVYQIEIIELLKTIFNFLLIFTIPLWFVYDFIRIPIILCIFYYINTLSFKFLGNYMVRI